MPLPSASRWPRFANCVASEVLPHVKTQPHEMAERGTALHAYRKRAAEVGISAAVMEVPTQWRQDAVDMPLDLDLLARSAQEVSYAYDVVDRTAREIQRGSDTRDYGELAPTEVAGTFDLVAVSADRSKALVEDLKTGRSWVAPAKDNWQLRIGALAVRAVYGIDEIELRLTHAPGDGVVWTDSYHADLLDLDEWAAKAEKVAESYRMYRRWDHAGYKLDVTEGPWCTYCPAFVHCPAKQALALILAKGEAPVPPSTEITPDLFPDLWAALQRMKDITSKVERMAFGLAREWGEAPIGEGKVLKEVETARESLDGPGVHALLAERFGAEVADAACKLSATKGGLKAALRPIAEKGQLAALEREVLGLLRERGAVDVKISKGMKETRA